MDDAAAQRDSAHLDVRTQALHEVVRWARSALAGGAAALELDVPDPDDASDTWPGARRPDGARQRSWRAWLDLADGLGCRCATPQPLGAGRVRLRLTPLGAEAPWHGDAAHRGVDEVERYAAEDGFAAVHKLEHPGFALPLLAALERVRPPDGGRVLALGCHRGDELAALDLLEPPPRALERVGIDRSERVLDEARRRLSAARFIVADVADLPSDLGRFDLVIAIGLLQSPGVDDKALLRTVLRDHLQPRAGLLIGLPNSRFRGGDVTWGARSRNYRDVDLSLVVRDLAAYRRYLQQHRFVVHIGGGYDLLLSAWRRP